MNKKTLLFLAIIFLWATNGFSQTQRTMTFKSYYSSPIGVYDTVRLIPQDGSSLICDADSTGLIYYDENDFLKICRYVPGGTPEYKWFDLAGAVGDLYWTRDDSGASPAIYPKNISDAVDIATSNGAISSSVEVSGGIIAKDPLTVLGTAPLSGSISGASLLWYPSKAAFRAGNASSLAWSDANIGEYSVAFGADNLASGDHSTVAGGVNNEASGLASFIGGGINNKALGEGGSVGGGSGNQAQDCSAIGGGINNSASAVAASCAPGLPGSLVVGGFSNTAQGFRSFVGGGEGNFTDGSTDKAATIYGGKDNVSSGKFSGVFGGQKNEATQYCSTVVGGYLNNSKSQFSTVGGGKFNDAVSGEGATVSGGRNNDPSGSFATIIGGLDNAASGSHSSIIGGHANQANASYAVVSGGESNGTGGVASWVGGKNMILGPGADRTFLWGHAAAPITPINTQDAFIIYSGNVGIGVSHPLYKLDIDGDINLSAPSSHLRQNGNWLAHPDYVFEKDYELLPLRQLGRFLKTNKHLPGIPSADEAKKEGVKLFEQNRELLKKVEEAHLYIFKLEERIRKAKAKLREFKDKAGQL